MGLPVVVAHPTRVRAFARVLGTEAKTDLLDAHVLARYGAAVPTRDAAARPGADRAAPGESPPPTGGDPRAGEESPGQRADAGGGPVDPPAPGLTGRSSGGAEWPTARSWRAGRVWMRCEVTGSPICPASSPALTALVGLARDAVGSGAPVRRALRPSAVRHACAVLSGPAAALALVAVMRKLLLHLNAVARRGTPWIEEPAPAVCHFGPDPESSRTRIHAVAGLNSRLDVLRRDGIAPRRRPAELQHPAPLRRSCCVTLSNAV